MRQSRLDRLNQDKSPKHLRRRMSCEEFFQDVLTENKYNARLYGDYVELAENLSKKGQVITIDATSVSLIAEKQLKGYFNGVKEDVCPLAILIYNIQHIQQREQVARFHSILKRDAHIVPDEVPIFIIEDTTGDYPLAREIIQNTDLLMQSKCYVFISHSHKDLTKVRIVRNYLEDHDFEPILFYLRCMDNENEDTEKLRELIYKEIDAREWFLYLDSANSRASDWVKDEIRYIEKSQNHVVKKICIDNLSEDKLIQFIDDLIGKLSIYICYSRSDKELANMFYEKFCRHGLKVFWDEKNILTGEPFLDQINHGIDVAAQNGGIVFLVTKDSLQSGFIRYELERAISLNARIYPIYFGDEIIENQGSEIDRFLTQNIQWIKCRPNVESIYECTEQIIKDIQSRIFR